MRSHRRRKAEFAALIVTLFTAGAGTTLADTTWEKARSRHDQDNDRSAQQNRQNILEPQEDDERKNFMNDCELKS